MSTNDVSVLRGLVLGLLYVGRQQGPVLVRPEFLLDSTTMEDVSRIGRDLREAGLVADSISAQRTGYLMRISPLGEAVWRREKVCSLEIDIPAA